MVRFLMRWDFNVFQNIISYQPTDKVKPLCPETAWNCSATQILSKIGIPNWQFFDQLSDILTVDNCLNYILNDTI